MKPLELKLKGFTGVAGHKEGQVSIDFNLIPDNAALVAVVGPNGAGKTTILDNMHPYRVMPSRATTMTPGGFSYWDNICEKEALKELTWEHEGVRYKSILNFKISGRTRKTECFLMQEAQGEWMPAERCGIVSDGKSDNYDAVVEAILGKPERFFTAQFSAQNRRLISDYGASEIKSLLASILSLGEYKKYSEKANDVSRLLQAHVNVLKEQSQKAYVAMREKADAEASLEALKADIAAANQSVEAAAVKTGSALAEVSRIKVLIDQETEKEEQRQAISRKIVEVKAASTDEEVKVNALHKKEMIQIADEIALLRKGLADIARQDEAAKLQIAKDQELLSKEHAIRKAVAELPDVQKSIADLEAVISEGRKAQSKFEPVKKAIVEVSKELAEITSRGKAIKQRIVMLKDTSSQIDEVPCKGRYQCPLIANAIKAKELLIPEGNERLRLCDLYRQLKSRLEALEKDEQAADELQKQVTDYEMDLKSSLKKEVGLKVAASQMGILADARERVARMTESLDANAKKAESLCVRIASAEKRQAEKADELVRAIEGIRAKSESDTNSLVLQLSKLGKGIARSDLVSAQAEADACRKAEEEARMTVGELTRKQVRMMATIESCQKLMDSTESVLGDISRIESEIAQFRLIEKGFGVNGIIALSIDDAGPAISTICNQLLMDCFDGRFSVRLNTQKETQKGDIRETFDVIVFDNVKGGEKELGMMSGGERVWVNECLTRAIALYVAQSSDTRFETLFTDEADGALDPERKRQFIAMKRSIIKTGGYVREYFVSQTPELWDMADYVLHVDEL